VGEARAVKAEAGQTGLDLKGAIQRRARELGFDDCRVTTAAAPASVPRLQRWLSEGRHGEMRYLERNAPKRANPQLVLPGARSIVTLIASYAALGDRSAPPAALPAPSAAGVVGRYARHADYHDVLAAPLKSLAEFTDQAGGAGTRSLWYVDTGPVLERDLAQRAGLGFIGKHTNLISRRFGNWILLAEILTTLELEPDAPEPNRCGSCTRCLAACPTGAITAPFQLEARRCISYLTIELKGPIPPDLRPAVGNRIFGCDDCLAVCPWNRFAREGRLMKAHRRPDLAEPDLLALLALDEAAFKRRFADTPIGRSRRRGLLRNVCVALGNVGAESALPALSKAAGDPEPLIAEHAAWAVEQICLRSRGA
jgi:epoxyqueuosine reductase